MRMLGLPNFGHMSTSTIYFESYDKPCSQGNEQKL